MQKPTKYEYFTADKFHNSPHVIILVGIPRTGKTTLANNYIEQGYTPICTDDIRRSLGVRYLENIESTVNYIAELMIKTLLTRGINLVIDETNIIKRHRKDITDICKKHNTTWDFHEIKTPPLEELKRRCEETDFDFNVILDHLERYEPLDDDEHYTEEKKE